MKYTGISVVTGGYARVTRTKNIQNFLPEKLNMVKPYAARTPKNKEITVAPIETIRLLRKE
jgi:hypothetical protein